MSPHIQIQVCGCLPPVSRPRLGSVTHLNSTCCVLFYLDHQGLPESPATATMFLGPVLPIWMSTVILSSPLAILFQHTSLMCQNLSPAFTCASHHHACLSMNPKMSMNPHVPSYSSATSLLQEQRPPALHKLMEEQGLLNTNF